MKPVKHLNMRQVRQLRAMPDDDADIFAICWACEESEQTVRAWFEEVRAGEVARVIGEIFELSGLTEKAGFPSP